MQGRIDAADATESTPIQDQARTMLLCYTENQKGKMKKKERQRGVMFPLGSRDDSKVVVVQRWRCSAEGTRYRIEKKIRNRPTRPLGLVATNRRLLNKLKQPRPELRLCHNGYNMESIDCSGECQSRKLRQLFYPKAQRPRRLRLDKRESQAHKASFW